MLHYFGTSLNDYVHCLWDIEEGRLHTSKLKLTDLDFSCYEGPNRTESVGAVRFQSSEAWSAIFINGSCTDQTKGAGVLSVFFTPGKVSFEELAELISQEQVAMDIINQMPFPVNQGLIDLLPRKPVFIQDTVYNAVHKVVSDTGKNPVVILLNPLDQEKLFLEYVYMGGPYSTSRVRVISYQDIPIYRSYDVEKGDIKVF